MASLLWSWYFPFLFFFRLLPSRVATADFPCPFGPIFCILLRHFNHCHVLFHGFRKPSFRPSPFPLSWHFPSSASFSRYTHHLSSVHVQTISVLPLVFSLQTVPPAYDFPVCYPATRARYDRHCFRIYPIKIWSPCWFLVYIINIITCGCFAENVCRIINPEN